MATLAEQAVDTLNDVFGSHPGYRAVHAKGTVCRGAFTATPEAGRLTRAAHMQGEGVPVTVRFSNAGGNPRHPDYVRDGRGMATAFHLPDGSATDIVAVTLPCFMVRTPKDFIAFTKATKPLPGPLPIPGPRLALYLATHPEAWRALRAALSMKPLPSFANGRYWAIHAFKWIDAEGGERHVRYRWVPEAGEASISQGEAKKRGRDYLHSELGERLEREPIRFTLELQLAAESDPLDDPTSPWPEDRETVTAGTMELTELDPEPETAEHIRVFDPTRMTDGIELSNDPILHFRSHAYSVSIERRSGIPRPPALDERVDSQDELSRR
jgi:catalase